jgi:hypothetical protein
MIKISIVAVNLDEPETSKVLFYHFNNTHINIELGRHELRFYYCAADCVSVIYKLAIDA